MTDAELVKRLRNFDDGATPTHEAADRIATLTEQLEAARADATEAEAYAEELERDLNICRMAQVVMENTVAEVEAKLAKAMTHVMDYSNDPHLVQFARETLAEIEGEKG